MFVVDAIAKHDSCLQGACSPRIKKNPQIYVSDAKKRKTKLKEEDSCT